MPPHKNLLFDIGFELLLRAKEAQSDRDHAPKGSGERIFQSGRLMAFNEVVSLLQQQAEVMGVPLADLRLDGIDPDRDLL